MIIDTIETTKLVKGETRKSEIPLRAVRSKHDSWTICMGQEDYGDALYTIQLEDCNDILQFFYHLRYVLGGEKGEVH